ILIVEYAKRERERGVDRFRAILAACEIRLRPIVMTSIAFILGVIPLLTAIGAGAEMRRALGVAVFAGMTGVTLFGLIFTPVFYILIQRVLDWWRPQNNSSTQTVSESAIEHKQPQPLTDDGPAKPAIEVPGAGE
ncbi:MAG: efflux RND transporter permease subunit, partial [Gemmataceae bacterium]